MSFIFARAFRSAGRSVFSDRALLFAPGVSLSFANHLGKTDGNSNENPHRKILRPVQVQQNRYFSVDFSNSVYESATSSEAAKFVIDLLIKAHELSGFHWWGILVATPLVFKLIYGLPCTVYQHKLMAKTELIQLQSKPLIVNLKHEILLEGRQKRWTTQKVEQSFRRESRKLMKKIMIDNNIHPFKIVILSLIQIPPLILLTFSISKLSNDVFSGGLGSMMAALQYQVGGLFWCPDLSMPDPTYVLPTTLLLVSLTSFELSRLMKPKKDDLLTKFGNSLVRVFSCLLFFVSMHMPAGLSLYWTSNAVFSAVLNFLLLSPRVKRLLRIPKTPSEIEKPYSHLVEEVKNRLSHLLQKK